MWELIPASFSCSENLLLSQSSLGLEGNNLVHDETEEVETIIAGDLSNLKSDLSLVLLLPRAPPSKYIFLQTQTNIFIRKTSKINILACISYHFHKVFFQFKLFICSMEC